MPNSESADETLLSIFGQGLRSLREERGFSLRAFAKKTGIHFSHLSEIENGKIFVRLDTLISIADVLDIEVSKLLQPLDSRQDLYFLARKKI